MTEQSMRYIYLGAEVSQLVAEALESTGMAHVSKGSGDEIHLAPGPSHAWLETNHNFLVLRHYAFQRGDP